MTPPAGPTSRTHVPADKRAEGDRRRPMLALGLAALAASAWLPRRLDPAGPWRAALDLAGGALPFALEIASSGVRLDGLASATARVCQPFSAVRIRGDSVVLEMADYAATITARLAGDSLVGSYRNVGNRGPRVDPVPRGPRPLAGVRRRPAALVGRWDATFFSDFGSSSAGLRAAERAAGPRRHDDLQHRRLRALRRRGAGRQLRPGALRRLVRVSADRRAAAAATRCAASSTRASAPRRPGSRSGAPAPPTSRHRPRSPPRTRPARSGSPFRISTAGW